MNQVQQGIRLSVRLVVFVIVLALGWGAYTVYSGKTTWNDRNKQSSVSYRVWWLNPRTGTVVITYSHSPGENHVLEVDGNSECIKPPAHNHCWEIGPLRYDDKSHVSLTATFLVGTASAANIYKNESIVKSARNQTPLSVNVEWN